jgi:hypothetical protein
MTRKKTIGEMLLGANLVDETSLALALDKQRRTGQKLGSALVDLHLIDENVLAAFLSKQIDVPCVSLLNVEIPLSVIRRLPATVAHQVGAMPVRIEGDALECAMIDPTDVSHVDALEQATGLRISPLVAPESSIRRLLAKYYPLDDDGVPAPAPVEEALFPELVEELEGGHARLSARLESIEQELRALRLLVERLVDRLGGSGA